MRYWLRRNAELLLRGQNFFSIGSYLIHGRFQEGQLPLEVNLSVDKTLYVLLQVINLLFQVDPWSSD